MGEAGTLRLMTFVVVLTLVAVAEQAWPRRERALPRLRRWPGNLGMVVAGTLLVRVVAPAGVVTGALLAESRGWGALRAVDSPWMVAWPVSVLTMDMAVYVQHVLMHKVPWFWRLHRVHHADADLDVTTGVRFHPFEYLLSLGLKMGVAVTIGAPVGAVVLFEVLLNATSMFNHANLRLPAPLDRAVRLLLVTPDMHRVHHSLDRREADSNYGFNVPWWDHLFGTYRRDPLLPHETMPLGVSGLSSADDQRVDRLLVQPFRRVQ